MGHCWTGGNGDGGVVAVAGCVTGETGCVTVMADGVTGAAVQPVSTARVTEPPVTKVTMVTMERGPGHLGIADRGVPHAGKSRR